MSWASAIAPLAPQLSATDLAAIAEPSARAEAWRTLAPKTLLDGLRRAASPLEAVDAESRVAPAVAFADGDVAVDLHGDERPPTLSAGLSMRAAPAAMASDDPMTALRWSLLGAGFELTLASSPARLLHLRLPTRAGLACARLRLCLAAGVRAEVLLDVQARASVVELDFDLAAGSSLALVTTGATGLASWQHLNVRVAGDAEAALWFVDPAARLLRRELDIQLAERGAGARVGVVASTSGRDHVEHRIAIAHQAADTRSTVTARSIAEQRARVVVGALARITRGADGSSARQSLKGMVRTAQAQIVQLPQLEIDTDDVTASHGATLGQLDAEAMYYLRARGLARAEAEALLLEAFTAEIRDPLPALLAQALGHPEMR